MKIILKLPKRTPPQIKFDKSKCRFNLSIWGRQSGKTTIGYRKMLWKPLQAEKSGVYWHILQTYAAADIVFERFLRFIHPHKSSLLKYKNESDRRVELIGGKNIYFKSGQNFEDLRTESLAGVIIDEARQQKKELWTRVVFPMLSKSKGWADLMTSPNGFDWIYDLKKNNEENPNWGIIHAPSTEAWWWTPEEIEEAKRIMSPDEFAQEIMAEFRNLTSGRAYPYFTDEHMIDDCPFAKGKPWSPYHSVILGLDFNLTPMSWELGQYAAENWYWFDEIWLKNTRNAEPVTVAAAKQLAYKILDMKEKGYRAEPNLILCGDASGNATQRTSNKSDYDIVKQVLKQFGITFTDRTPKANPSIIDRVNAVNGRLRDASGEIHMWFLKNQVPKLVRDLDRVSWRPGAGIELDQRTDPELTHPSDAIGYPVTALTPIRRIEEVGKLRIIQRTL